MTPRLKPPIHTHTKLSVLEDRFSVVLTWHFLFFTFSDNTLGCQSHMATQNGPMTLEIGRPYAFGGTGCQSLPVTILVKLWQGGEK